MTQTKIYQPTTLEFYKSAKPTPQPADDDGPKGGKDDDAPNGGRGENHVETLNTVYALELVAGNGEGVCKSFLAKVAHFPTFLI